MKTKDQILLEKVYSKMVLKENFDLKEFFQNKPAVYNGNLDLRDIKGDIDLSFLKNCEGNILASNATSLDLSNLEKSGGSISAGKATSIDLRNLRYCYGMIFISNVTPILDLRNLKHLHNDIKANSAKFIDLRNLFDCWGNITASSAETIIIPKDFGRVLLNVQTYGEKKCKVYNSIEQYEHEIELYKTGFEPEKMLDPERAEKLGGLFFNRNEN